MAHPSSLASRSLSWPWSLLLLTVGVAMLWLIDSNLARNQSTQAKPALQKIVSNY